MEMIVDDPQLLNNIVFSDKTTFELTKNVNRHNFRLEDVNPDWVRDNTQYPQKKLMYDILNGRPVGPFFIEGNLNVRVYEVMLREQIILAIQNIAQHGENLDDIYFQQDGASPHYGVNVHQYLSEVFPDRWIG